MLTPLDFVCPECKAAIGAKCTERQTASWMGCKIVNYFHNERQLKQVRADTKRVQLGPFKIIPHSVYVSGSITGMPNGNIEAFAQKTKQLREQGYFVINPTENGTDKETWNYYMRKDISELMQCEAICMLPGWQRSKGANIEFGLALQFEMRILEQ